MIRRTIDYTRHRLTDRVTMDSAKTYLSSVGAHIFEVGAPFFDAIRREPKRIEGWGTDHMVCVPAPTAVRPPPLSDERLSPPARQEWGTHIKKDVGIHHDTLSGCAKTPTRTRIPTGWRTALAAWAVLATALANPTAAQWDDLRAVGGKNSLWVLYEAAGESGPETRVWMRQLDRGFRRPRMGEIQPPGLEAVAACGQYLHVFYKSGTHYRLGPSWVSPQIVIPGRSVPPCLAGDSQENVLYAVAAHFEAPATRPTSTTAPAEPARTTSASTTTAPVQASAPSVSGRADGLWDLYRFHRGSWQSIGTMPTWFSQEDRHWMCAEKGTIHLVGLGRGPDAPVWHRSFSQQRWSQAEEVPVPTNSNPIASMVVNTYVVVVVRVSTDGGGSKLVALRRPAGQEWQRRDLLTTEGKAIDVAPDRISATSFKEKIALVGQFTDEGSLEVGFWTTEGGPPAEKETEPLPRWPDPGQQDDSPGLPQVVVIAILAAVMLLTLWRRQESLMNEVSLPNQVALADVSRRFLAFLIDLAPAIAIAALYWLPKYTQLQQQIGAEDLTGTEEFNKLAAAAWWPWLSVRVLYAFYCGVTEYRLGTSPGKRLLRCWIVSTDLTPPNIKQIAIRNATKVLELQPEVMALLVFIMLTRNRQRLGDLLAGTLVVEPATPTE